MTSGPDRFRSILSFLKGFELARSQTKDKCLQMLKYCGLQARCLESKKNEGKREEYLKLCQLRGLVVNDVDEVNDLGETKLMASAAEGRYLNLRPLKNIQC
jgi:uncharacterized protein YdbL (DUF1318 family)